MRAPDSSATVWANNSLRRGSPKLLFGWTHEDAAIELEAFAGLRCVFCIAGAGCTAMALAADGHDVTAVDINPCQVEYAKARAGGAPARPGAAERLVARGRTLLPFLGWRRATVREFLSLDDTKEQTEFWDRRLDTRRWRAALSVLLAPRLLALAYAPPLLAALPPNFDAVIRERLRRGWAAHPNRHNPHAWRLLAGEDKLAPVHPASRNSRPITFECADAAGFLESRPPASFDAFSLSNIVDGASPAYIERLAAAARRAAAPRAIAVIRSFAEPRALSSIPYQFNFAARDRSLLWGSVDIRPAAEF
jgi:S-adenosylmethionine:diacylglycerol 3-amino-3-carboxypropyl transferase